VNCVEFEERIALFVENDLSDAEVTAVDRHLESCAQCREFAAELRASQAMLKGLRREPIDDAAFADVRSQVIRRVSNARTAHMWPKYAIAATLLVMLAAAALWKTRPASPVGVPAVTAHIGPGPALSLPAVAAPMQGASQIPRMTVRHGRTKSPPNVHLHLARQNIQPSRPVHPQGVNAEPLVVKLLTNDPQVVIYWLVDQNGG
jgi:anti-sigma factor RsiW